MNRYELLITGWWKNAVYYNKTAFYFRSKKDAMRFLKSHDFSIDSFVLYKLHRTKIP